jgi:hypothetical protein
MKDEIYRNPLTGDVLHTERETPMETEQVPTESLPTSRVVDVEDTSVLVGTINVIVESVRINPLREKTIREHLGSPTFLEALEERLQGAPEDQRDALREGARRETIEGMEMAGIIPPAVVIIRQRLDHIPLESAKEIADSVRAGTIKGRNKVADLISGTAPVPGWPNV